MKLSWWNRIRLLFVKPYISVDTGNTGDFSVKLKFKMLEGVTYLTDVEVKKP